MKFSLNVASNMVNPEGHAIELRYLVIMINKWKIKYSNVWDYFSTYLYIIYITITQKHLRCQQILFYGTQYLWYAYFMSNTFFIWFLKVQMTKKKILNFSCNYPSNMAVFINGLNAWKSFFAHWLFVWVWFGSRDQIFTHHKQCGLMADIDALFAALRWNIMICELLYVYCTHSTFVTAGHHTNTNYTVLVLVDSSKYNYIVQLHLPKILFFLLRNNKVYSMFMFYVYVLCSILSLFYLNCIFYHSCEFICHI